MEWSTPPFSLRSRPLLCTLLVCKLEHRSFFSIPVLMSPFPCPRSPVPCPLSPNLLSVRLCFLRFAPSPAIRLPFTFFCPSSSCLEYGNVRAQTSITGRDIGQYHARARAYFKTTQLAWNSLQAQPINMTPSAVAAANAEMAAAAVAAAAAAAAAAAEVKQAKSSKRRQSGSSTGKGSVVGAASPKQTKGKTHPHQTKPGPHAEAVHEQQLLSRPKTVRTPNVGVRKDLLTGTTKVCHVHGGVRSCGRDSGSGIDN